MAIDTSIYKATAPVNPLQQAAQTVGSAREIKNVLGSINKIRGGMPATGEALGHLGAGMPYVSPYSNIPTGDE